MKSKMQSVRHSLRLGIALLLLLPLLLLALPAGAQSGIEVVASGLNNPRGIAIGPEGAVYVAEAGKGGDQCYDLFPPEPDVDTCLGLTGAITRIWGGQQTRVVQNLASLAGPEGIGASGPVDISFQGRGGAYVILGLGANPELRDELAANVNPLFADLGQLVRMDGSWKAHEVVDVSAYEALANPDGESPEEEGVDSNPYAVAAIAGRRIVADAGGNDLLLVNNQGEVSTLAIFPYQLYPWPDGLPFGPPPGTLVPLDPVPTSVVQGPDGAYYVGQLDSLGVGIANVYRVPAGGGAPEVYAGGFTAIIDIAFAPDGSLYVLEIAKNGLIAAELFGDFTGALIHVGLDGTRTEIASEGLFAPGGMALASDGSIYVTNNSIFTDAGPLVGEVLRIPPGYQAGGMSASSSAAPASLPHLKTSAFAAFRIDIDRILSRALDTRVFLPNLRH
jgi:DNA-binding beta-propeller fold protein YncE